MEKRACAFGECTYSVMQWKSFPHWHLCEWARHGMNIVKPALLLCGMQNTCTSLILWCSPASVSRQLVCCVRSKVWTEWNGSGERGRLGWLKAGSVLCVFGPSLFGIRAWLCVSNLGRTCRCLDRMIVENHVFV
jgi:hypothetical protein